MDDMIFEVIEFAIEKEQEAVDFYNGLAEKIKQPELKVEIKKLAGMEAAHKRKLQELNPADPFWSEKKSISNLKIAEYIVEEEVTDSMDLQDILVVAMKRELAAKRLYLDLAQLSADSVVKKMFEKLASEEAEHKNFFEKLWDEKVLKEN